MRVALRRNPLHNRIMARGLTKAVSCSLLVDSRRLSEEAATEIGACIEPGSGKTNLLREYAVLNHWYRHASVWAPNPSHADMEKVTGDFCNLYQKEDPHLPVQPWQRMWILSKSTIVHHRRQRWRQRSSACAPLRQVDTPTSAQSI